MTGCKSTQNIDSLLASPVFLPFKSVYFANFFSKSFQNELHFEARNQQSIVDFVLNKITNTMIHNTLSC